jgi:hypothetical protein
MIIEAGKSYRTKNGRKATVSSVTVHPEHHVFPIAVGHVDGYADHVLWFADGSGWTNHLAGLALDIPWVDPPKKVPLEATVHADGKVEVDLKPLGEFCPHKMTFRHDLKEKVLSVISMCGVTCCDL